MPVFDNKKMVVESRRVNLNNKKLVGSRRVTKMKVL